jgi:hypothetical protein
MKTKKNSLDSRVHGNDGEANVLIKSLEKKHLNPRPLESLNPILIIGSFYE